MFSEVIFDVETKKFFDEIEGTNPADLGVSVVSLYQRALDENLNEVEGNIQSFWEDEFEKMWPIFQNADRIVGYNTIGFDVPALEPYANFPISKLPHFDVFLKVKEVYGRRIPLDAIAKETLGRQKTDVGAKAVEYWNKGDKESLEKLQKYCEQDVLITKDIYDFGLKEGYLKFKDKWNTPRKVEIDFTYPKEDTSNKQIGLF